jgi:cbb3-type cytochrome oxidase maturation protein
MSAGFVISIVVFIWALNNGQFRDQQRARFIPLENDSDPNPVKASRFARIQTIALFALVCICLSCSLAVIIFSLFMAAK